MSVLNFRVRMGGGRSHTYGDDHDVFYAENFILSGYTPQIAILFLSKIIQMGNGAQSA